MVGGGEHLGNPAVPPLQHGEAVVPPPVPGEWERRAVVPASSASASAFLPAALATWSPSKRGEERP